MKRALVAGMALALLLPAGAFAQSAFNGTWVTQLSSVRYEGKPHVISLRDGMYACDCSPPIKVKADGADHAVTGHHGFDTVAVQIVSPLAIRVIYKDHGKVVTDEENSASADGKTGESRFTDYGGTSPETGKATVVRVGSPTPGVNAVDGTWKFGHWVERSANGRTHTYQVDGKSISYSDPMGRSYHAVMGGEPAALAGPGSKGGTMAVKQLGPDELQMTFRRDGKVQGIATATVAKDGKTMKTVSRDPQGGDAWVAVADRQ